MTGDRNRIRPADVADADTLARVQSAAFNRPWDAETFALLLAEPISAAFVMSSRARIRDVVAFVVGRIVVEEAEILALAVHPDHRRQALGRGLMQHFLRDAAARGVTRVFLEVAEENVAARGLYGGLGFQTVGVRRGYYAPQAQGAPATDALLMDIELELAASPA